MNVLEKIFGSESEYQRCLYELDNFAEMDRLPICLEVNTPGNLTVQEIGELVNAFKVDAEMNARAQIDTCNECGEVSLHIILGEDIDEDYGEDYDGDYDGPLYS